METKQALFITSLFTRKRRKQLLLNNLRAKFFPYFLKESDNFSITVDFTKLDAVKLKSGQAHYKIRNILFTMQIEWRHEFKWENKKVCSKDKTKFF